MTVRWCPRTVAAYRCALVALILTSLAGCGQDTPPSQSPSPTGSIEFKYFIDATRQACAVCRGPNCGPDGCDPGCLVSVLLKNLATGQRDSLYFGAYVGGDGHLDGNALLSDNGVWLHVALEPGTPHNTYAISLTEVGAGTYQLQVHLLVSLWNPAPLASSVVDSVQVGSSATSLTAISAF
jgi:hypothetical protein